MPMTTSTDQACISAVPSEVFLIQGDSSPHLEIIIRLQLPQDSTDRDSMRTPSIIYVMTSTAQRHDDALTAILTFHKK